MREAATHAGWVATMGSAHEAFAEGEEEAAEGVALEVFDGVDVGAEDFEGGVEGADGLLGGGAIGIPQRLR